MTGERAWYHILDADEIDTPALVIYPQRVEENIRLLKTMIDDPQRLRPHVKTHKSQEATLLLMDAGIDKFKCATIAEAEMTGICKAADVLLAYQPFGPKLKRFIALIEKYPGTVYSCLTDNLQSATHISEAALDSNIIIPVYIDLNTGMNRTGIKPGRGAIRLYEDCVALKGIHVVGFHAYDGHIRNRDMQERARVCDDAFAPVMAMQQMLLEKGYDAPKIIAGGSPTFPIYALKENIECSPGTFIYWDKGYQDSLPEQAFLPAALVITRVISFPGETTLCLDMGYKSIASENAPEERVHFLNAPGFSIVSQSEEHLVVEAGKDHSWKIGDVLYGLPIHICPTCAVYDTAITITNGAITGNWKSIARDRKISI